MTAAAIFGLGLIGGSLALALRRFGVVDRVVGVDAPKVLGLAHELGLVDELVSASDLEAARQAGSAADVVLLATPVAAIQAWLDELLPTARLISDCGSTKRGVLGRAARSPRGGRFVPGHPLAGLPQGGLREADAMLFQGRRWVLCPELSDADALEAIRALLRPLGAEIIELSAADHDRAVALTSHVPQLLASALCVLSERRNARHVAGPAFERATRVAGGAEAIWRDIFATNGDLIAEALRELTAELTQVAEALERTPQELEPALDLLDKARRA